MSRTTFSRLARLAVPTLAVAAVAVSSPAPVALGATCTPTWQNLVTKENADPLLIGPRGHVLTSEADAGALAGLWLHRPNGTVEAVTAGGSTGPGGPTDVNGHGAVLGTSNVGQGTNAPYVPWAFQRHTYSTLSIPDDGLDYVASALNGAGTAVGVKTNARTYSPSLTNYIATAVTWPTLADGPIPLPLPNGYYVINYRGRSLIDVRSDGLVSAVVDNHAGSRYLARWTNTTDQPTLVALPAGTTFVDVAGRWVLGQTGPGTLPNDVLVMNPKGGVVLDAPNALTAGRISQNGSYVLGYSTGSVYGRGPGDPRDAIQYSTGVDVAGLDHGTAVVDAGNGVAVLGCTAGLGVATYVTVTPLG